MKLTDDARFADLRIEGRLSALEIESLIRDLAELRNRMIPEVPRKTPDESPESAAQVTLTQDDADFYVALRTNGHFRFAFRNRGIGWLFYTLSATKSVGLAEYIKSRTSAGRVAIDFIRNEIPDGDKPH